jgi:hypothetical protein
MQQGFANAKESRVINTNNLWVDLRAIEESWTDLPLIVNRKPVIPHDEDSEKVIQLESAMGAAIGTVENAGAIEVGRDRFFPVKTTNDLFAVRSDLYELNDSSVLEATVERRSLCGRPAREGKSIAPSPLPALSFAPSSRRVLASCWSQQALRRRSKPGPAGSRPWLSFRGSRLLPAFREVTGQS